MAPQCQHCMRVNAAFNATYVGGSQAWGALTRYKRVTVRRLVVVSEK